MYPLLPPAANRAVVPSPVRVRRARGARASAVAPVRAIVTSAVPCPPPAIVRTRHHGRCDVPPRSQQVSGTPYDTFGVLCLPRGRTCVMMLSLLLMPFVGRWRRHKHCHLSPPSRPLHRPEQRRAAPRLSGPLAHDVIITVNAEYRPERAICGHSAPWEPIKHAPRLHMLLTLITPCTPATCRRVFPPPPAASSRSPSSI